LFSACNFSGACSAIAIATCWACDTAGIFTPSGF
jgi:hypothetical protein